MVPLLVQITLWLMMFLVLGITALDIIMLLNLYHRRITRFCEYCECTFEFVTYSESLWWLVDHYLKCSRM